VTDNEKGMVAQAFGAMNHAVRVLPPAFIVMALLNIMFLAVTFYYLLVQQADRTELLRQILTTCTVQAK